MNTQKFWKTGFSPLAIFLLSFLAVITFPNNLIAQPPAPPEIEPVIAPAPAEDWTVTISVDSDDVTLSTQVVSFGVAADATDGKDDLDETTQMPPPAFGQPYLNAAFGGTGFIRFSKDLKKTGGPWSLIVQSSSKFTLSWDSSTVPADYPLSIDGTDMSTNSSKELASGKYVLTIEKAIDITIDTVEGGLGTEVTVSGTNFGVEEEITIDFGTETGVATATTDAEGSFSGATFAIATPQPAGNVTIKATGATSGQFATTAFVYEGPSIGSVEIAGSPAVVGGKITVTLIGEENCSAKFSIADITTEDVEMTESEDTPGTYVGKSTISTGDEGVLYDVTATLTDTAENEATITAEETVEITAGTQFVVTLNPGTNLFHIPVADSRFGNVSDLYTFLVDEGVDLNMIIYYDTDDETFRAYGSWSTSAEDIALEPHTGLIAILKDSAEAKDVTFNGGMYEVTNVPLEEGINLIGLPAKVPSILKLSDLATAVGDNLATLIAQDETGKFVSHLQNDLDVAGNDAFIVITQEAVTLELEGEPWSNPPSAAPAILISDRDMTRTDVMVVQGATILEESYEAFSGLNVTVQNLSTKLSQTDVSGRLTKDGRFSVVFVNLSGRPVGEVGDLLRISVEDPTGKFGAEPIQHRITEEDVSKGIITIKDLFLTKIPEHSALLQNYPNPFNPETWIPFQLAKSADVTLKIYNLSGQVIRKIDLGYKTAGTYTSSRKAIYWDGLNNSGERAASGIYFYSIEAGSFNVARKMIVVK